MKSARFGFLLLSSVVLPFAVQAGELPFLTPEEAVSMAITPRNNVKNTLHKAVPAEVAGLNQSIPVHEQPGAKETRFSKKITSSPPPQQ